jgi:hypothetical protein
LINKQGYFFNKKIKTMNRLLKTSAMAVTGVAAVALLMMNKCSCDRGNKYSSVQENPDNIKEARFIDPFSDSFNVSFTEYTVQAGKDTMIKHASGTKIMIPACAFAGKNGERISGEVKVKYREMMNRADIIASGIPMKVKPGEDAFLETAGMMEFRAFQGENELKASENCQVRFEMVNTMASKDVNLYYLDPDQKSWLTKIKDLPAKLYKQAVKTKGKYAEPDYENLASAAYTLPAKPKVANPSRFSFHFKIDLSKYPEVNVYDGILWEYAGNGGSDDPKKNAWVENARWKEMKLDKTDRKGIYKLKLSSSDKTFETIVRPVFDKEDMEYAMDVFNDRYEKYQRFVAKKKEEHRKWVAEQERQKAVTEKVTMITRTFSINNFGIWNCDRLQEIDNPVIIAMDFKTEDTLSIERAYLIDNTVNSVICYSVETNTIPVFKYAKDKNYKMLLLDSKAKVHLITPSEFSAATKTGSKGFIKIEKAGKEVNGLSDLNTLI